MNSGLQVTAKRMYFLPSYLHSCLLRVMVLPLFCDLPGTVAAGGRGTPPLLAAAGGLVTPSTDNEGGPVEGTGDAGGGGGLQLQTSPSLGAGGQAGAMAKALCVRPRGVPVVRGQGRLPRGTCQAKAAVCHVSQAINN